MSWSGVKIGTLGLRSVSAINESGERTSFVVQELPLGADECFQLSRSDTPAEGGEMLAIPSIEVMRSIAFAREEWVESSPFNMLKSWVRIRVCNVGAKWGPPLPLQLHRKL
jgi:hypothetical protein